MVKVTEVIVVRVLKEEKGEILAIVIRLKSQINKNKIECPVFMRALFYYILLLKAQCLTEFLDLIMVHLLPDHG